MSQPVVQKTKVDPAILLSKLKQWLKTESSRLTRERLRIVRSQEHLAQQETLLVNSATEATFVEVLQKVEELEYGSENVNKKTDFLGADKLPPVHLTGELDEM